MTTPTFEQTVANEVARIRSVLQTRANLNEFNIQITARGRVNDGSVRIVFSIGDSYYNNNNVESHTLENALGELLRRIHWQATNNPIYLPNDYVPPIEDTAPTDPPFEVLTGEDVVAASTDNDENDEPDLYDEPPPEIPF